MSDRTKPNDFACLGSSNDFLSRAQRAASVGLDGSPGDPLMVEALAEIARLTQERDEARNLVECRNPVVNVHGMLSFHPCGWCEQCEARKGWGI